MCNPALAVAGFSAIVGASSARNSANAQQQSFLSDAVASDRSAVNANNNALVAENNAELASWQARDSIRQGETQVAIEQRTRQQALDASNTQAATIKSQQRVGMGAAGVDLTEGSAADVLNSTDYIAGLNANNINDAAARNTATIRDNAVRNAWGYTTQGTGYKDQAATARADAALYNYDATRQRAGAAGISPNSAAAISLLGSAGQVAPSWYSMKKVGG